MNINENYISSLKTLDGPIHNYEDLKNFFDKQNEKSNFETKEIGIQNLKEWSFDSKGNLSHKSGKFFKVTGVVNETLKTGILLQNEIGTLGCIASKLDGILHFLIQFKKEPGNIVSSQLSPTLQATISNQQKVHGGNAPKYMNYFQQNDNNNIIVEKLLPEQGNRYWRKFNNNIIVLADYFDEENEFKWMTLGQIYEFTKIKNSVNSCLRSVLSLLPTKELIDKSKSKKSVEKIIDKEISNFEHESKLEDSVVDFQEKDELFFNTNNDKFHIKGFSIAIKDREVSKWDQPLIYDPYLEKYILISIIKNNKRYYLLKKYFENGYENGFVFGPTYIDRTFIDKKDLNLLLKKVESYGNLNLIGEIEMSEEGGRFINTTVNHCFYEITTNEDFLNFDDYLLLDHSEIHYLNYAGYLGMEARSLLFLSTTIYKGS